MRHFEAVVTVAMTLLVSPGLVDTQQKAEGKTKQKGHPEGGSNSPC